MLCPEIFILGYSEAAMLLTRHDVQIAALLAICGQGEFPVQALQIPHQLILRFDDIDVMDESDPIKASAWRTRRNELAALGRHQNPPTIEDARRIIAFANTIRAIDGPLLCHCLGGVSRSSAAALLIMAAWTDTGAEAQCVHQLRLIRPCASPHRDLVKFGDTLLNRGGRLLSAMD